MRRFEEATFVARFDKSSGALFADTIFERCVFNCTLSDTTDVKEPVFL